MAQNTHPDRPDYVGPIKVMPMSPELRDAVQQFNWRMNRAEAMLRSEADLQITLKMVDEDHRELFRAALAAYLRENSDD